MKLPDAGKRMRGDRQDAAGGRSPGTVEDGIDEIGEVPGDSVAAVLPTEHRLADGRTTNVQPNDILIIPASRERDRALRVGRI